MKSLLFHLLRKTIIDRLRQNGYNNSSINNILDALSLPELNQSNVRQMHYYKQMEYPHTYNNPSADINGKQRI